MERNCDKYDNSEACKCDMHRRPGTRGSINKTIRYRSVGREAGSDLHFNFSST